MLVKLTPGRQSWCKSDFKFRKLNPVVNFTNILHATFLYEIYASCFFVLTIYRSELFGAIILAQKLLLKCW